MVFRYFIPRFLAYFLLFFVCLTLIFTVSDTLVRVTALPIGVSLPRFFLYMMPFMSVYTVPLAAALGVGMVIGTCYLEHEALLFRFLSSARKRMHYAVGLFALMLAVVYTPLVWHFAPESYWRAKNFLMARVADQFSHLPPQLFHSLTPSFTFYHQKKEKSADGALVFRNVILDFSDEDKESYLIIARECEIIGTMLFIRNGTVHSEQQQTRYRGVFMQTELDLARFFAQSDTGTTKQYKFFTRDELLQTKKTKPLAFVEYHKRWAQVLWLLIFPFLALWGMLAFGKKKSNLALCLGYSGAFFLGSYITLNTASVLAHSSFFALLLLYGSSSLAALMSYRWYKQRWM